jgi:dipeptidyl aminopeptidase/acylaminoacyl peptidase
MYMMTEELWFPTWDNEGAPWDNNPVAKRHYAESPHKKVTKWDTPIMVTHGEMDYRVPVEQGMAAFNAAQMMGVPSRMLLFPEENHWILRPQNAVHWQRSFFDWFDKWLK